MGLRGGNEAVEEAMLIEEVKLTDFGAASPQLGMSKEDERSLIFAERAQKGDYDDGGYNISSKDGHVLKLVCRTHPRTISTESSLPHRCRSTKAPISIHNSSGLRRRRIPLHSCTRSLGSLPNSTHRLRSSYPLLSQSTCGRDFSRCWNTESWMLEKAITADHTMGTL